MTMKFSKLPLQGLSIRSVLVIGFWAISTQMKTRILTMMNLRNRHKTWWCHETCAVVLIKDLASLLALSTLRTRIRRKRPKCLWHLLRVECGVNLLSDWPSSRQKQLVSGKSRFVDSDLVLTKVTRAKMKAKNLRLKFSQEATLEQPTILILKITSKLWHSLNVALRQNRWGVLT